MSIEKIIVAAIVLYAVVYLTRYIRAAMQGKKTGCGCGSDTGCPKSSSPKSE